jgi:hypothetical protein
MYLDGATCDLKGEDEADKFTSRNALGGLLVFTRFFNPETKAFTRDPCIMVIALPSTGLDGSALTLMVDEIWGDDKLTFRASLSRTWEIIH